MISAALASASLRLAMTPTPENYIGFAREQYAEGRIDLVELERRVEQALSGTYVEPTNDFQVFA